MPYAHNASLRFETDFSEIFKKSLTSWKPLPQEKQDFNQDGPESEW